MKLKDFSIEIEKLLKDEELLRLLHNKPKHRLDDPLDINKPNILAKPIDELWGLIDFHLVPAPKYDDLEQNQICRIFYYAGDGRSTNTNYLFSNQEYTFEVLVHYDFQIMDKRLEMICDRLNELIFDKRIGGIGKTLFKRRHPVNTPNNYLGFRLVYEFCNENF